MKIGKYVWTIVFMVLFGVMFAAGYLFANSLEERALVSESPATAGQYHNLKYGFICIGIVMEVFFGLWMWRKMRIERAKPELIKLVLSGKMTTEEAAKKLHVSREFIKDTIKELKEEGVVE